MVTPSSSRTPEQINLDRRRWNGAGQANWDAAQARKRIPPSMARPNSQQPVPWWIGIATDMTGIALVALGAGLRRENPVCVRRVELHPHTDGALLNSAARMYRTATEGGPPVLILDTTGLAQQETDHLVQQVRRAASPLATVIPVPTGHPDALSRAVCAAAHPLGTSATPSILQSLLSAARTRTAA